MPRPLASVAVVVLALIAGTVLWTRLFPSDEAEIRALLDEVRTALTEPSSGRLEQVARARAVSARLAPDITIDLGAPWGVLRGREAVLAAVARAAGRLDSAAIQFQETEIVVAEGREHASGTTVVEAREAGQTRAAAREFSIDFQRIDGQWLIAAVAAVAPLDRLETR